MPPSGSRRWAPRQGHRSRGTGRGAVVRFGSPVRRCKTTGLLARIPGGGDRRDGGVVGPPRGFDPGPALSHDFTFRDPSRFRNQADAPWPLRSAPIRVHLRFRRNSTLRPGSSDPPSSRWGCGGDAGRVSASSRTEPPSVAAPALPGTPARADHAPASRPGPRPPSPGRGGSRRFAGRSRRRGSRPGPRSAGIAPRP
jgi:hypothetical protein